MAIFDTSLYILLILLALGKASPPAGVHRMRAVFQEGLVGNISAFYHIPHAGPLVWWEISHHHLIMDLEALNNVQ